MFATAAGVFADYKFADWRAAQQPSTPAGEAAADALWEAAHRRNAALLLRRFTALGALWVKMGQYLSSRADVMPAAFISALGACQDSLPAPPFSETQRTVEAELGRPLGAVFARVDQTPLAVASIAAVYRAALLDGREARRPVGAGGISAFRPGSAWQRLPRPLRPPT